MDLTVEPEEERFCDPETFFLPMEFMEVLPVLLDEPLTELSNEEQEVVSSILVAAEGRKDLEGGVGLGRIFRAPPEEGIFNAGAPLPATFRKCQR